MPGRFFKKGELLGYVTDRERPVVRVVVQLKDDGSAFPVILPKKRIGESASVEVRIGPDP